MPAFLKSLAEYRAKNRDQSFRLNWKHLFPILSDRHDSAGSAQSIYFYQDLWAARKIFEHAPRHHVDIGSRIDGFVAHLLVFMSVTVIDIRPLEATVLGLRFIRDDATQLMQLADDSVESLSSLNAAEHFGLGRYSDPIDPSACFKFMNALQRVLSVGGKLYFSVPVGRERVEFNAHRVFSPDTVLKRFSRLRLVSFSFVGDDGVFHENGEPDAVRECNFACGFFEFTKL